MVDIITIAGMALVGTIVVLGLYNEDKPTPLFIVGSFGFGFACGYIVYGYPAYAEHAKVAALVAGITGKEIVRVFKRVVPDAIKAKFTPPKAK